MSHAVSFTNSSSQTTKYELPDAPPTKYTSPQKWKSSTQTCPTPKPFPQPFPESPRCSSMPKHPALNPSSPQPGPLPYNTSSFSPPEAPTPPPPTPSPACTAKPNEQSPDPASPGPSCALADSPPTDSTGPPQSEPA